MKGKISTKVFAGFSLIILLLTIIALVSISNLMGARDYFKS